MRKYLLLFVALACASTSDAALKGTHRFFTEPFRSGPEVTGSCSGCHSKLTEQITHTVHWNWGKKQTINGRIAQYGKINALGNSFCLAVPSNLSGCTNCHAGYGWKDGSFDFGNTANIDCLVCHEASGGAYRKVPLGAGNPVYEGEKKEFPAGTVWEPVDLRQVARTVERPPRSACGACHFYGGGGDNYKHGDLDSTLANPSPDYDVHMGRKGLTCESCHKAANHDVRGEAISVSVGSTPRAMGCTDCHKGEIHKVRILNRHMRRVACQTCHIPTYAKGSPTVLSWDWSAAGKEGKAEGPLEVYDKARGKLVLGRDLVPTYMWYNGTVDRVYMGEKIDPGKVVPLSAPRGNRSDPDAKIFPFKVMKARQPYDTVNLTVAVPNIFGPADSATAYSATFDWNKAIEAGMKAAGLPYSGKYGWIDTTTVWSLNHMVVPKEKALRCGNCHVGGGRIDWKRLGYDRDPRG